MNDNICLCPFLLFWLEVYFVDMSMATPTLFWLPFAWGIILHPITLILCLSLELRWVSWRQHIVGSSFHPAALCFLIGGFNPFTLRVIINKWGLSTVFYLLFSGHSISPFFFLLFLSAILIWWFSMIFFSVSSCFIFHVSALIYVLWLPWGFYKRSQIK